MRNAGRWLGALVLTALAPAALGAAVLEVPGGHPTIKSAVSRAAPGDVVVVDDGVYLEKNIVVAAAVTVRARNPYGAVIYGSRREGDAIFIVREAARIEGFVLRNSDVGIEQRGGPDVRWEASDLAFFDCMRAVSINDPETNSGSAVIRRVAIFGFPNSQGLSTNDADRMVASQCLIVGCESAFQGYDHRSFEVEDSWVVDCALAFDENTSHRPVPPATSRIDRAGDVRVIGSASLKEAGRLGAFESFLRTALFAPGPGEAGREAAPSKRALMALVRGRVLGAAGFGNEAARSYAAARAAAERAGSKEMVWRAMTGAARIAEQAGDADEALARYEEAAAFLEDWLADLAVGIYRIDFLDEKMPVFESLVRLLLERHRAEPGGRWAERAFLSAERSKRLAARFRTGPDGEKSGGGRARPEAAGAIVSLQTALQDPDLAAAEKTRLIALLENAEEEYHAALVVAEAATAGGKKGSGSGPGAGALPSPLGFGEVGARLGDAALLSYVLGDKASYAFLATGNGVEAAVLPDARTIGTAVERYLRFLQLADGREFRGARAGRRLFETLVGPFAARLDRGGKRLIVVPDGVLRYLPFEALVADGTGKQEFLGRTMEISYAGSAAEALAAAPAPGGRPGEASDWGQVLAVGRAEGIACDNRSPKRKRTFSRLRHVGEEIERIGRAFPARRVTAVVGEKASEAWLKSADLARFGVVHLAAHGVIDDENWWRSALLFEPGEAGGEDGFLTALEIPDLRLAARLVVLSGCGTGGGRLFGGAGLKGLSEAFLRAGAERVLVSLWSVDDRATAVFMGGFYEGLAAGETAERALARAKRRMMDSGYGEPFYWAPFVLIGRAGGR